MGERNTDLSFLNQCYDKFVLALKKTKEELEGSRAGTPYTGHALATSLASFLQQLPLHPLLAPAKQPLPGELREGEGSWSGWRNSGESPGRVQGWVWPTRTWPASCWGVCLRREAQRHLWHRSVIQRNQTQPSAHRQPNGYVNCGPSLSETLFGTEEK